MIGFNRTASKTDEFTDGPAKGKSIAGYHSLDELVKNLLIAMGQRIDGLDWMSDATKKAAHEKLSKFTVKIGYRRAF